MTTREWALAVAVLVFLLGFFAWIISNHRKLQKENRRPFGKRDIAIKTLAQLPKDETIIVVAFSKDKKPIVQFIHEFQKEMMGIEGDCFILQDDIVINLEWKKSYAVIEIDKEGTKLLQQVALFITADSVVG